MVVLQSTPKPLRICGMLVERNVFNIFVVVVVVIVVAIGIFTVIVSITIAGIGTLTNPVVKD